MEKAIWKSEYIYASSVKESYELEKLIREASAKGELRCPDSGCESSVLKYCHGNKRRPYFAHKYISLCDYDRYDRNNTESINDIKYLIFKHLTSKGIKTDIDKKVFERQYAHLMVLGDDCLAVELVLDSATSRKIKRMYDQYKASGISVQFLVIGNGVLLEDESDSNFIRRFSLNETFNNNLLVINEDGFEVYQYRMDTFKYICYGMQLSGYQSIYYEKACFEELTIENGILSICGFNDRYNCWFDEKQSRYKAFITPKKTLTTTPQENPVKKTDVIYEKFAALEDVVVTEAKEPKAKNKVDDSKVISISDLKWIELISLPEGKPIVELFQWSEEDFMTKICQVCYEFNDVAFKQLITKMKNPNSDEKRIVNELWTRFKVIRPEYFYILKTAFNKSKQ